MTAAWKGVTLVNSVFLRRAAPAYAAIVLLLVSATGSSADNRLIPFQARVVDGSVPPVAITGNRVVVFSIYADASSTSACWTEEHPAVPIVDGQLNVQLGTIRSLDLPNTCSPGGMAPGPVNFDAPRYLGIKIGAATNAELVPRHQLVPSFHARTADQATLAKAVEDNIVRTASIQVDAVTTAKIKDGEVMTSDLGDSQITTAKVQDGQITRAKLSTELQDTLTNSMPVGTILDYGGATAPPGFLICNGAAYDRTQYPELFAVIGTSFGTPDAQKFNVPDLRGFFTRMWDQGLGRDPDAASRSASKAGGATGNNIGSSQADAFRSHQHTIRPDVEYVGVATGLDVVSTPGGATAINVDQSTSLTGGSETRPLNIYVNKIIKY